MRWFGSAASPAPRSCSSSPLTRATEKRGSPRSPVASTPRMPTRRIPLSGRSVRRLDRRSRRRARALDRLERAPVVVGVVARVDDDGVGSHEHELPVAVGRHRDPAPDEHRWPAGPSSSGWSVTRAAPVALVRTRGLPSGGGMSPRAGQPADVVLHGSTLVVNGIRDRRAGGDGRERTPASARARPREG